MSSPYVVEVDNVSKRFCRSLKRGLYYGMQDIFRAAMSLDTRESQLRPDEFWALKNINFKLEAGDALGLVGTNGSGKSTLLRVLTGIYPPDKGQISLRGRVSSLIALGAGFHPHMSGRENISLNATILGMTPDEIKSRFDEIVQFADIGPFLDAPVATYSSGMVVRLGFAVAIHCRPEIVIIDEVFAVGDITFQHKCLGKMLELRMSGVTTIFVSHSASILERMCKQGLLLVDGEQKFFGPMRQSIKEYIKSTKDKSEITAQGIRRKVGLGNVEFSNVVVYERGKDPKDKEATKIEFGKDICIDFNYHFIGDYNPGSYVIRVSIVTMDGRDVQKMFLKGGEFLDSTEYAGEHKVDIQREGGFQVIVKNQSFFPQTFRLDINMENLKTDVHEGGYVSVCSFQIAEPRSENRYFEYGNLTVTEYDYEVRNI